MPYQNGCRLGVKLCGLALSFEFFVYILLPLLKTFAHTPFNLNDTKDPKLFAVIDVVILMCD